MLVVAGAGALDLSPDGQQPDDSWGRDTGRLSALTVVLPLRPGGLLWLGLWLRLLRHLPQRTPLPREGLSRRWAVGQLDRLRFVAAIRWSLLPPLSPEGRRWLGLRATADARWQLLFESNFDGDWDDYLDVFGAVMAVPIRSIVGVGRGFPGLGDITLFKDYTKSHDHEPEHYACAYGDMTSGDVYQAMVAREGSRARYRAFRNGYGRHRPRWTTLFMPIREGRTAAAVRAARALAPEGADEVDWVTETAAQWDAIVDPTPLLLRTGTVHFARAVVVERPSGSWLLLTFTHDDSTDELLAGLVAADAAVGPQPRDDGPNASPIRRLVECCRGVPAPSQPTWDDTALVAHLRSAVPPRSTHFMAYCGYSGMTVAEIQSLRGVGPPGWPARETET